MNGDSVHCLPAASRSIDRDFTKEYFVWNVSGSPTDSHATQANSETGTSIYSIPNLSSLF